MEKIRQASKKQLTILRKVQQKKYRYSYHLFVVEGVRATSQILDNHAIQTEALFFRYSSGAWEDPMWLEPSRYVPFYYLKDDDFNALTDTQTPQPVVALCRMPLFAGVEVLAESTGILVALDRIQDPGNLGTILRTAAWFGAAGLILGTGSVDLYHPKVVRSTAGAIGSIIPVEGDIADILNTLETYGWQVALLEDRKEADDLSAFTPPDRIVIVVGNEAAGIDDELHSEKRVSLRISGNGHVESLNAAVASGISLYEISKKIGKT